MRYIGIKESIFQKDQKDGGTEEKGRKKSIAFRNDSIVESWEAVHGRQNTSIALFLKASTKEAVKEVTWQKGLPANAQQPFHILYFSRTYHFVSYKKKEKTNNYDLSTIRTGAEGKINLRNSLWNSRFLTNTVDLTISRGNVQTRDDTIAAWFVINPRYTP